MSKPPSLLGSTSAAESARDFGDAAVEQSEHLARLLRLKKAATMALVAWPLFGIVDWFIVGFVHPGRLWYYLLLRAVGLVLIGLAAFRLHSKPAPSPRMLRAIDTGVFATLAGLISLASVECGGLESPLALGVVTVLLCRSALLHDNWRRAILPVGLAASIHPLALGVLTLFSPEMQAQLADPRAIGGFVLNELFIAGAAALTLIGGHAVWALRRKVFEARSLGRYRLKRRIGKGGMGEVWLAHHRNLGRDVAVKILRPDKHIEAEAMRRFEREVRATADLCHPNTVRVFDYGVTEDGLCYYAMELLEGEDLGQLVQREGRVAPQRALEFIRQAASALAEAHARGIVHRDIKPENLFVTSVTGQGELIKVLDFGLAKHDIAPGEDGLTCEGFAVGTPAYISPEVLHGRDAESRSDIYGLGCVLYHLLSGEPPFADDNPRQVLIGHMCKPVPPLPGSVLSRCPQGVLDVLSRCLAKNVGDRYTDALELASALEALVDPDEAPHAARRPAPARASRHARGEEGRLDARVVAHVTRKAGADAADLPTTQWTPPQQHQERERQRAAASARAKPRRRRDERRREERRKREDALDTPSQSERRRARRRGRREEDAIALAASARKARRPERHRDDERASARRGHAASIVDDRPPRKRRYSAARDERRSREAREAGQPRTRRVQRLASVAGSLETSLPPPRATRAKLPAPPSATRPGKGTRRIVRAEAPRRRYAVAERVTREPEEWDTLIDSPGPLREVASM